MVVRQKVFADRKNNEYALYAQMTTKREMAQPNESTPNAPPGVQYYLDSLAALVPSEVLALHALILTATTEVNDKITTITDGQTLQWSFYALIKMSIGLYVLARRMAHKWDSWDWARMLIPALSFVGWTMLQRATAFDATGLVLTGAERTVIALFFAVILSIAATGLSYQIDQKQL